MKFNVKAVLFALAGFALGGLIGGLLGLGQIFTFLFGIVGYVVGLGLGDTKGAEKADSEAAAHAKSMVPAEGQGGLYIVRTGFVAKLVGMETTIKGTGVSQTAQIKGGEFASLEISPGDYTVDTNMVTPTGKPATMNVSVVANKTVVIVATVKISNDIELALTEDSEEAKKLIGKSKMIVLVEA